MSPQLPPPPTFLIIGAQKCATRWLRFNLGKHPDVYAAPRELEFFNYGNRFRTAGIDGYRAQFEGWAGEPYLGEATPGYMIPRHRPGAVAKRIQETVPDVRLIALVREPVDRARSAMAHHIRRGRLPSDLDLLEIIRRTPPEEEWLGLVAGGWYAASLTPYRRLFGDQLRVLLYDDILEDPRSVYAEALRHIGADPDFVPGDLDEVVFSNRTSADQPNALPVEARRELYEYFRDDIRKLERMIHQDLSIWRPEGVHADPAPGEAWMERFARTADWVEERVRGVSPDQYDRGTSRADRRVRDVLDHLIGNLYRFVAKLRHEEEEQDDARVDIVRDGDPVTAYRTAAETLRAALAESGSSRSSATGRNGWAPVTRVAALAVVDQLVNGWDLAAATGQGTTMPDDLAESAEAFVRRLLPKAGTAVTVDELTSPTERLVAYQGRDPAFRA